ncbi:MAG: Ig-like domain repeat protein, partial [Terriglobales bacterium]
MRLSSRVLSFLVVLFTLLAISTTTFAAIHTSATPKARVTARVDNSKRTTLYGHVPAAVRSGIDMGRVEANKPVEHLIMVLKSDEDQKREVRRVIDEQQDKRTANYHQWVTPEEFGEHFGVADSDIENIKAWFASEGLTVESVNKSKRALRFSGSIGQLEHAFQTEMHYFLMPNGETHVSNSRDISVPEAFKQVIAGVPTLNDFFRKSHRVDGGTIGRNSKMKLGPKYTSSSSVHYVSAADFATIYNTAPLLAQGINGTGVTIGVVGRSDILLSDVQTYRQMMGLPPNDPNFIHAGQDNGTNPGDDGESDLDVEISGGAAPGATVDFVIGTPTFLVDGITNSTEYIIENNIADIMSVSYGDCEANEGAGGNAFNSELFEQGAAQGISIFIASGDNGPAGCDDQGSQTYEVLGYAAPAEASTWYSVAVGGTEFYGDGGSGYSTYWSPTNNATNLSSALKYIPEYPWNEARVASPTPSGEPSGDFTDLWSGTGAVSAYYLRPPWQTGSGINGASDPALNLANGSAGNWVASINITNPGSGYTTAPAVTFGTGCTGTPAATGVISGGQVTGVTFTGYTSHFQGFNCTTVPTVTFAAPTSGTTALGTAVLGPMQYPAPLITGVPHRLSPDLALNAASGHDATFFCSEGVCELNSSGGLVDAGLVGGTSVAAPSMAGVQALINQANGGRQGMPGYMYYTLAAAQNATACNSSTPPASGNSCAFQDVTLGNNFICGLSGSSCSATLTAAKIGFAAGTGYDLATGLGSPNAANLASQWSSVVFNSSNTTLNLSQTSFTHGTSITLSGTVASGSSGTPTGDVAFIVSQGAIGDIVNPFGDGSLNGPVAFATLSGGSYTATLNNLPGGTYYVTARYGGDQSFASSLSAGTLVTVAQEGSGLSITPYALSGSACTITAQNSFAYGSDILVNLNVAGISGAGAPTGTVALSLDGNQIANLPLDPNGNAFTLSGAITSSSCIYDYNFDNVSSFPAGSHTLTATYSGDGTYNASTATPVNITVSQLTPTLTLAAGATTITAGSNDNLVATFGGLTGINGNSTLNAAPTGTVTFTDTTTSTILGTAPVVSTALFSGNNYTFSAYAALSTTAITTTGANSITATYSGDAKWAGLTSSAVTVTVGTGTATTVAVTSSANPTTLNGRPTFTATVTTATAGAVTFYDGASILGAGSAVGTAHTSTFRPASGAAFWGGTHNITAIYGGSGTTMASTSPVFVETVTQGTNTINLTCKTAGTSTQVYTCAAVLTPSSTTAAFAPNQGVVNFLDGATNIGSGQPITVTSAQGGYALWTATVSASLAAGTHTITATYSDINYSLSTSNAQTITVGGDQTISWVTPPPPTAGSGSNFTVAATASSGLTVTYTSAGTCSNSGALYTMNGSGSCTVIVNQAGNSSYGPAPALSQYVNAVNNQKITFTTPPPANAVYNSSFSVAATASSGLTVSFAASGPCSVIDNGNGTANYTMTSGVGTCSVIVNQGGNANWPAALTLTGYTNATRLANTVTFTTPAPPSAEYGSTF